MTTHQNIDRICLIVVLLALALTGVLMCVDVPADADAATVMGYENLLFDDSRVHTIDLVMDDWEGFLSGCEDEQYVPCSVVIDGESFKNVGIRAKGNSSLSMVSTMDSDRYSFKLEFDHYDSSVNYHGLDKLSLNNLIQDATCMKDYLAYTLMDSFGVESPLCSYVYIRVNGEDWGLYLAVEGVEEAFLRRNYGTNYGQLYKPETEQMGGMGGFGSQSTALSYIDDDPDSYGYLFDNAKTEPASQDRKRLIAALKTLSDPQQGYTAVDVDAVLRYFVVHNYLVNADSYTGSMVHNYYLYESDGVLSMIPWDYNLSFGAFQSSDATAAVNDPIDTPLSCTGSNRPMFDWIFSSEALTAQYHAYFEQFLQQTDITARIEQTSTLIAPYVQSDPTAFYTYEAFQTATESLKSFCQLREQSIQAQLRGALGTTQEAQRQNGAAKIDASSLTLSDMGSSQFAQPGGAMAMPVGNFEPRGEADAAQPPDGNAPDMQRSDASTAPELPQDTEDGAAPPELPQGMPEGMNGDFSVPELPDGTDGDFTMPEMPDGDFHGGDFPGGDFDKKDFPGENAPGQGASNAAPGIGGTVILLALSVLVLLAGLLFAFKFRK